MPPRRLPRPPLTWLRQTQKALQEGLVSQVVKVTALDESGRIQDFDPIDPSDYETLAEALSGPDKEPGTYACLDVEGEEFSRCEVLSPSDKRASLSRRVGSSEREFASNVNAIGTEYANLLASQGQVLKEQYARVDRFQKENDELKALLLEANTDLEEMRLSIGEESDSAANEWVELGKSFLDAFQGKTAQSTMRVAQAVIFESVEKGIIDLDQAKAIAELAQAKMALLEAENSGGPMGALKGLIS